MKNVLDPLKFVYSAIDKKSAVIEMTHFLIENGHVRATNGVLSLGSPIELDLKCAPHAETALLAVRSCKDVISLSLTDGGRLRVGSGRFRALVPCSDTNGEYHPKPSGMEVDIDGEKLLAAFQRLEPFVAVDNLRPWANGILLRGQSAFATNNICLIEAWLGVDLPLTANIPLAAIKAVTSQNTHPSKVLMDERSITFMYDNGRWIKTQLYESEWPLLERILNVSCTPREIPKDFFAGIDAITKFTDNGRVYFRDGKMCSSPSDKEGATYEVEGLPEKGLYKAEAVKLLAGVATSADFDRYPETAIFYGENVRGAVIGMRE